MSDGREVQDTLAERSGLTIGRQTRRRVLQSILAGPVLAGLGPTIKAFGQEAGGIITAGFANYSLRVRRMVGRRVRGVLPRSAAYMLSTTGAAPNQPGAWAVG